MIKLLRTSRRSILLASLFFAGAYLFVSGGAARAGLISEEFPSDDNYPSGTVVSLRDTVPTSVELASVNNSDFLIGVVENNGDSLLAFGDGTGEVSVATIGQAEAFVTDLNGDINIGDFIGASWIKGVGMKASDQVQQKLLGIAIEDFNSGATHVIKASDIKTPNGTKEARIGKIAIRLFDKEVGPDINENVSALESFASRIAGKDVTLVRIIASVGLFIVTAIISGIFLANAIRGSFISIGRNPLSSGSVFSSLMQVSGVSISLLLIGAVLAYIVLIV